MEGVFNFNRRQFLAGLSTATVGLAGCTEGILSTRREWRFDTEKYVFTSPTFDEDTVYAGYGNGILYAFRASDGTVKWQYEFDESIFVPSVSLAEGVVYIGDVSGTIHAVDAASGDGRWRTTVDSEIVTPTPVVDEVVYAGKYAFDAANGDVLNELPIEGCVFISVVDRTAHVGYRNSVYAFNPNTNSQKWKFDTGALIESQGAAVTDGSVYVGNLEGEVYALDAETGKSRWKVATGDSIYAPPTVAGDTVYVGSSDRYLYALDIEDGTRKWRFDAEQSILGAAAIADETVYLADNRSYLYALDADTGDERWRFNLETEAVRKVTLGPEYAYIGSVGSVQAIRR